ncbi:hypothetical protein [Ostreiculturibacter nitratireducens]|uniref:hypothetical protein n=1 Tax=Ostreiculturibacter nitratireducens TaxID=3075226 RepID=UPI0031B5A5EB
MAKVSEFVLFWRAFLVALIVGVPVGGTRVLANDDSDWAFALQAGTRDGYVRYLRRNPAGAHIDEAIRLILQFDLENAARRAGGAARQVSVY